MWTCHLLQVRILWVIWNVPSVIQLAISDDKQASCNVDKVSIVRYDLFDLLLMSFSSLDLWNFSFSALFRGVVLNLYPQQGHHIPSHRINISHTWHRFWPFAYRDPPRVFVALYFIQMSLHLGNLFTCDFIVLLFLTIIAIIFFHNWLFFLKTIHAESYGAQCFVG